MNQYEKSVEKIEKIRNFFIKIIKSEKDESRNRNAIIMYENIIANKAYAEPFHAALDNINIDDFDDFDELWNEIVDKNLLTFRNGTFMLETHPITDIRISLECAYDFISRTTDIENEIKSSAMKSRTMKSREQIAKENPDLCHWSRKLLWINESPLGGRILCDDCAIMEQYGYGSMSCRNCEEAVRLLPDGSEEYYEEED